MRGYQFSGRRINRVPGPSGTRDDFGNREEKYMLPACTRETGVKRPDANAGTRELSRQTRQKEKTNHAMCQP